MFSIIVCIYSFNAINEITLLTSYHTHLLSIIIRDGAYIVRSQIFITSHGRALDKIIIKDRLSGNKRLPRMIMMTRTKSRRNKRSAFTISPSVTLSNGLSNKFTVIDLECLDRPGLLADMSALIADLFRPHHNLRRKNHRYLNYLMDLFFQKVTNDNRQTIATRLEDRYEQAGG